MKKETLIQANNLSLEADELRRHEAELRGIIEGLNEPLKKAVKLSVGNGYHRDVDLRNGIFNIGAIEFCGLYLAALKIKIQSLEKQLEEL